MYKRQVLAAVAPRREAAEAILAALRDDPMAMLYAVEDDARLLGPAATAALQDALAAAVTAADGSQAARVVALLLRDERDEALTLAGPDGVASVRLAGGLRPYTLYQVWLDMDRVWTSLFARFGWMNVRPPAWVWIVWSAIAIIAAVGGIRGLMTTRWKRPLTIRSLFHPALILLGWFLLVAAAWLQFMLRTPADQGRLFFPALTTLALRQL